MEQGVQLVGFDTISVGDLEIHQALQREDLLLVEMMCGLGSVLHQPLLTWIFPLKMKGVEASPTRAIAETVP